MSAQHWVWQRAAPCGPLPLLLLSLACGEDTGKVEPAVFKAEEEDGPLDFSVLSNTKTAQLCVVFVVLFAPVTCCFFCVVSPSMVCKMLLGRVCPCISLRFFLEKSRSAEVWLQDLLYGWTNKM